MNRIAVEQAKHTQTTEKVVAKLLNYASKHPKEVTQFQDSGVVPHIHSDVIFLFEPVTKRRVGGTTF